MDETLFLTNVLSIYCGCSLSNAEIQETLKLGLPKKTGIYLTLLLRLTDEFLDSERKDTYTRLYRHLEKWIHEGDEWVYVLIQVALEYVYAYRRDKRMKKVFTQEGINMLYKMRHAFGGTSTNTN
jgi:hypothetical protein